MSRTDRQPIEKELKTMETKELKETISNIIEDIESQCNVYFILQGDTYEKDYTYIRCRKWYDKDHKQSELLWERYDTLLDTLKYLQGFRRALQMIQKQDLQITNRNEEK